MYGSDAVAKGTAERWFAKFENSIQGLEGLLHSCQQSELFYDNQLKALLKEAGEQKRWVAATRPALTKSLGLTQRPEIRIPY